jgi:hypothetical protein
MTRDMYPEEFKFQRDASGKKILLYNKSKTIIREIDGEFEKIISSGLSLGPSSKCYAAAFIDRHGRLNIGQKLPNLNW